MTKEETKEPEASATTSRSNLENDENTDFETVTIPVQKDGEETIRPLGPQAIPEYKGDRDGLYAPEGSLTVAIPCMKGDKGDMGMPGKRGLFGLPGEKGEQGHRGLEGPKGSYGPPGLMGPKGAKGDMGSPGQDGFNGMPGRPGAFGEKGNEVITITLYVHLYSTLNLIYP